MNNSNQPEFLEEDAIDIRKLIEKYSRLWPYIVLFIIISLGGAYTYLRYAVAVYSTTATILIKDEDGKGANKGSLEGFVDLDLFSGLNSSEIENEIGILKSRTLANEVVKRLHLNMVYFQEGRIKTSEAYINSPFLVKSIYLDEEKINSTEFPEFRTYKVEEKDDYVLITNTGNDEVIQTSYDIITAFDFGELIVSRNDEVKIDENGTYYIQFYSIEKTASALLKNVSVSLVNKDASLISIKYEHPVPQKARDIIDQLIIEYNRQAIEDKNLVASSTADFIDERLVIINNELELVESGKETFKSENALTDIVTESSLFVNNAAEYNKLKQNVGTQLELVNSLLDYVKRDEATNLLPANLGIEEANVNNVISEYNELVLEKSRLLAGSTTKNPIVIRISSQITAIKDNVIQSLQRLKSNLQINIKELNRQSRLIGSQIASVPEKERVYRGIERQQNIKETLYLFLLQKREENSLNLAVTAPKAKIVDYAYTQEIPIAPKKNIIYLAAVLLGAILPVGFVITRDALNTKVNSREELDKIIKGKIPVVGELPSIPKGEAEIIDAENDRSQLAEACRILMSNLQFVLNKKQTDKALRIIVTSTVKGEGKTFTATNLAITLANLDKKVLLLGADLRNPQLQRYDRTLKRMDGISDYLSKQNDNLESLIIKSTFHPKLNVIPSGSIPPNPAELWRSERAEFMLDELSRVYDYIILDTAPTMLVADTTIMQDFSDLTLFTVRAGFTHKGIVEFVLDAVKEERLKNVAVMLNDVKLNNYYGYGYGYSYGYKYGYSYNNNHQKKWYKRIFSR